MSLCAFPIASTGGAKIPCGQCMNCRINRRRAWAARVILESTRHDHSWFVTLTYADQALPRTPSGLATVKPLDLQLALKRIRKDCGAGLRFFAVGEYGTRSERPHYHAIFFGMSPDWFHVERGYLTFRRPNWWPYGFVSVAEFNQARASYVAHYTTKKWTIVDPDRLGDRHPEFMRSSRRPGIGVPAVDQVARLYETNGGPYALAVRGDVLTEVRLDGRRWPLDRHMREKLRVRLGVPLDSAERPPIPKELHPLFREITDADQEAAVRRHDKARRKAKFHGTL